MPIEDLPDEIKKHILNETGVAKPHADGSFGVTELLSCLRKTYFRRIFGEEIDLQQAWWFYRGNLLDSAWTSLFERNQVRVTHRVKGYPIIISGRFDFEVDGAIADLKTVSDLSYVVRDGYKEEHKIQLAFYCYCEAKTKARLYYVSFHDAIKFEIEFEESELESIVDELERRAITLWKALSLYRSSGIMRIPRREEKYNRDFWECRKCSFRERCYPKSFPEDGDDNKYKIEKERCKNEVDSKEKEN